MPVALAFLADAGTLGSIIAASDGKQPDFPYLVPPDDSFYGTEVFAGSHVAWLRGVSPSSDGLTFDRMEVWASLYSPDPAELQPYKVGDFPGNHLLSSMEAGGHGKYSLSYIAHENPFQVQELVYDLTTKAVTAIP